MELDVEVHSSAGSSQTGSSNYATAGNGTNPIDNTPTNAEMSLLKKACDDQRGDDEDDLESLYPSVPLRTSSILPRPAMVCKVKSVLNLNLSLNLNIYFSSRFFTFSVFGKISQNFVAFSDCVYFT